MFVNTRKNYVFNAILVIRAKATVFVQISKYSLDERMKGIFAFAESLPTSAALHSNVLGGRHPKLPKRV